MRSCYLLILLIAAVGGCSGNAPTDVSSSANPTSNPSAIVVAPKPDKSASSEEWQPTSITMETAPEIVCREFIEALQHGQTSYAEKLLSQESITNTRGQSLDLATPAGPGATYAINAPMYATTQQKIAFVLVNVHESGDSQAATQPFTLMLRKGGYGWKITGIMLGSDAETQDLYSFENPLDVARIKSLVEGEPRQAAADDGQAAIR